MARRTGFRGAACSAVLAISACAAPDAPTTPPSAFDAALAGYYATLADAEYAESDFLDYWRFRAKQRAAEAGMTPQADALSDRALPERLAPALAAARAELIARVDDIARLVSPDAAAHAQAAFDCWIQEAEEDLAQPELETCRRDFEAALASLGAAERDLVVLLPSATATAIAVSGGGQTIAVDQAYGGVAGSASQLSRTARLDEAGVAKALAGAIGREPEAFASYTVYFETGGAELAEGAQAALDAAVADATSRRAARVAVYGHADRVGSQSANVRFSRARAERVAQLLVAAGVPAADVASDSFGELRPAVPTPDGVAEPLNRRVEIVVR